MEQKTLIKHLQTEFNTILKRSYIMVKLVSFQGCKDASTHSNQKDVMHQVIKFRVRNHTTILINASRGEHSKHWKMGLSDTKGLLHRTGNCEQSKETVYMVGEISVLTHPPDSGLIFRIYKEL